MAIYLEAIARSDIFSPERSVGKSLASQLRGWSRRHQGELAPDILYLGLITWFATRGQLAPIVIIYLVILGSLMISYSRARAEGLGLECKVGLLARPERVILLGVALLLDGGHIGALPNDRFLLIILSGLAILTFFTLTQRIWHIWRLTLPAAPKPERRAGATFQSWRSARRARHP